ncbi:D-cysteine desulfhydrase family protein [Biomaibacter acetigenes]|uniref:D-cysteine desulfhydrase family protein n=1 Tax=Biomaibacter acetigenes TaxID=2316383 RepID=A0A3G2R3A4_9FIRM|nr:D-cysteine desulfhydrase family protein [Biomaibacter acetigenes]AYO29811.1 D-cysteine desulfhydrase family protein [Biomaibacter acetigenes]
MDLLEKLNRFPKVKMLWGMTPIVRADNISRETGVDLYVKRDDLTGLALGGNKTRKLEFLMGEALACKCDTVVTAGAVHSNHALQTAAASKKLGLAPILVLRGKEENLGNLLMDKLLRADIRVYDVMTGRELNDIMLNIAEELEKKGKNPMVIPIGGSNPTGALGYIKAAAEILEQERELGLDFDYVISPSSSGGTQAGLLFGFNVLKRKTRVLNIGVGDPRDELIEDVLNLINDLSKILDIKTEINREIIESVTVDGYGFGGYGTIVKEVIEVIMYAASREGFYLDPVYSGKAFCGMLDLIDKKIIPQGSKVLFIHTGGLGGIFQYEKIIGDML